MDSREIINFLKGVDIFSLLKAEELEDIYSIFKLEDFSNGQVLCREGERGDLLFILMSGKISSVVKLPESGERKLADFFPGDFFGEMAIFEDAPRSATCFSSGPSRLVTVHRKDFFGLLDDNPDIAIKIMYRMLNITIKRLDEIGEFLADTVRWGEDARKRSITDNLTGIYNRRFLDEALENHFESASKSGSPISIIMIDLDLFTSINDTYGEDMGNMVIMEVVKAFRNNIGQNDIIARYGGDEFTVVLPGRNLEEASSIARRAGWEVEKAEILKGPGGVIRKATISQGVASFPENATDLGTLKHLADQALYKAKEDGRNRVICASV